MKQNTNQPLVKFKTIERAKKAKAEAAPAQCGQHTPLPWVTLDKYTNRQAVPIGSKIASSGGLAHNIFAEAHGHNCEANGQFIARACNSHYELLEALKDLVSVVAEIHPDADDLGGLEQARSAIAKAESNH